MIKHEQQTGRLEKKHFFSECNNFSRLNLYCLFFRDARVFITVVFLVCVASDMYAGGVQLSSKTVFGSPRNIYEIDSTGVKLCSVQICDLEFDGVTDSVPIKAGYAVKDIKSGKIVGSFYYEYTVCPQKKIISMRWNPLGNPEKLADPKNENYEIKVTVQDNNGLIEEKIFTVKIQGIKASLDNIEMKNRPRSSDYYSKLRQEGVIHSAMIGTINISGLVGDKWKLLNNSRRIGVETVDIREWWFALQPSSESYDWSRLDNNVKWAKELGIPVILSVVWAAGMKPDWFKDFKCMFSASKDVSVYPYTDTNPSLSSPKFREIFIELSRKLVERYRNEDVVMGFHVSLCDNDVYTRDISLHDVIRNNKKGESEKNFIGDYSEYAANGFRKYVEDKYKTITALNNVYNAHYSGFAEIELPKPMWNERLDRRPIWFDFQIFKSQVMADLRDEQFSVMRALTADRWLYAFVLRPGILDILLKPFKKHNAIANVSIYGPVINEAFGYIARKNDVKVITEDFWSPLVVTRETYDSQLLQNIASGSVGHIGVRPTTGKGVYAGDYAKMTPIFHKMAKSRPTSKTLGIMRSVSLELAREKTFNIPYYHRGNDKVGGDELSGTGPNFMRTVAYCGCAYDYFTDYSDLAELPYKLILDYDSEIMSEDAMNRIVKYVKDGGNLVLFADSGKYTPSLDSGNNQKISNQISGATDMDTSDTASHSQDILLKKFGFPYRFNKTAFCMEVEEAESIWKDIKGLKLNLIGDIPGEMDKRFRVLAEREDHKPAVIEWTVEKGKVLLVTGVLDWNLSCDKDVRESLSSKFLQCAIKWAGGEKDVDYEGAKNIRSSLTVKDGSYFLICYNDDSEKQACTIKVNVPDARNYQVIDMLENAVVEKVISSKKLKNIGIQLSIEGKRCRVFEIK